MIQQITKPFREFFKLEASSGIMLLIAAILALVISNGSYSDEYFSILKKYVTLGTAVSYTHLTLPTILLV